MRNTIIILMIAILFRLSSMHFVNNIKNTHMQGVMHDVFHRYIPDFRDKQIVEKYYDLYSSIPIVLFLMLCVYSKDFKPLNNYTILFSVMHIIRCIFYSMTVLPDPSGQCQFGKINSISLFFDYILRGTCRDLMFSGHTATILLSWKFLEDDFKIPSYIGLLHTTGMIGTMMALRKHYSIDVVIAILVTSLLYNNKIPIVSYVSDL